MRVGRRPKIAQERTPDQIIAEALEILQSRVKTAKDMRRLMRLALELEELLEKGD